MAVSLMKLRLCRFNFYKTLPGIKLQERHCSLNTEQEDIIPPLKYEATQNPDEWKYVERILPQKLVPDPKPLQEYPSGWKPQGENVDNLPYFIRRTKNHMLPVYLHIGQFGIRKLTYVKHVTGDIWLLEKELKDFLQADIVRPLRSQVHELAGYICIYGDHVNAIKYYLEKKNL